MSKALIEVKDLDGQILVTIDFVEGFDMNSAAHDAAIEMACTHSAEQGISEEELAASMNASMEEVKE